MVCNLASLFNCTSVRRSSEDWCCRLSICVAGPIAVLFVVSLCSDFRPLSLKALFHKSVFDFSCFAVILHYEIEDLYSDRTYVCNLELHRNKPILVWRPLKE